MADKGSETDNLLQIDDKPIEEMCINLRVSDS
jgi:hypothetical protein